MERETGEQGGVEFACQAVARVARKRSARHVLDYAEAGRAAIVDRPERASHRVRGLRGRDGHHEHRRRRGQEIGELLEALDPGRQVHQQQVEGAPGHVGEELAQRGGLERAPPLAFRGPEAESDVWRGALEAAALREFLADVAWGPLDLLLVDLPPGIQRFQELADLLPAPPAVLVVTIPTPESADAVRRALRAVHDRGAPCLGVIENMTGGPFAGDAGDSLAREFDTPLLARLPFHPGVHAWDALAQRLGSAS